MKSLKKGSICLGFGEWLWDKLPTGKRMGGAPANFAFQVSQCGMESCVISATGKDVLGRELLAEAGKRGLRYIVSDSDRPTGTVDVEVDDNGVPQYRINENVAWDNIVFSKDVERLCQNAGAICFGSLAQRSKTSRDTLQCILECMQKDAMRIFDVNLRQSFYTEEIVCSSLQQCNVLKMNEDEVKVLQPFLNAGETDPLRFCGFLIEKYALEALILTCGAQGSYVFGKEEKSFLPTPKLQVADTVGAGDSFTAAFCAALLGGKPLHEAHRLAVEVSAYVCTQPGAMPLLPETLKQQFTKIGII